MGIKTVAIYTNVDKDAPHVLLSDESVNLGDPTPIESYLNIPKIIKIAKDYDVEAIHPGYGFLAENPDFANSCKDKNIKFIGPDAKVISLMGDKIVAKTTMDKAGVPVIPGYHGPKQDNATLIKEGKKIGAVTSGTMSPSLKKGIALGYVHSDCRDVGTDVEIKIRDKGVKGKIVKLPFVK